MGAFTREATVLLPNDRWRTELLKVLNILLAKTTVQLFNYFLVFHHQFLNMMEV